MNFAEILAYMKQGGKVKRPHWGGYWEMQKGYPDGIPCNKQTADAWGMEEGELFKCEPYMQINTVRGSHSMWVPSITDLFAADWVVKKEEER